jgi:hypothetical protein
VTDITKEILAFGSNTKGIHGAGAAHYAFTKCGAIWGKGEGLMGNSYAIPTKDDRIRTLPITKVQEYVNTFIEFAKANPDLTFMMTAIGTGLAGFEVRDIAPMFKDVPENVKLPTMFLDYLYGKDNYDESRISFDW